MNQPAVDTNNESHSPSTKGFSLGQVILILFFTVVIAVGVTSWLFLSDVFTREFEPVELDSDEVVVLDQKLRAVGIDISSSSNSSSALEPEAYSEAGANREVSFSERELNAILARNTDLAQKLALDLSGDLLSAKLLLPLDEDLPFLGGQTLKVTAGLELRYTNEKPVVVLKGVSIWGVPVPSAYLGDIKNIDLVKQYGDAGFWKQFSAGIDNLEVSDGNIRIQLAE